MEYFYGKKFSKSFINTKLQLAKNLHMQKTCKIFAKISTIKQNKCFICGGKKNKKETTCYGINYLRCLQCSHVYVDRRVSEKTITKYYSKNIDYSSSIYANKHDLKLREDIVFPKIQFIKKFVKGKNWLDVGSADGSAVYVIKKTGFNVTGIEISENSRKFAKKYRNVSLYPYPLYEFQKKNKKKWNVISFFGVLEHLPEPMKALKICNTLLVKNGVIALAVPNYDSISTYVLNVTSKPDRHLIPYSHIMLFSLKSLEYALLKAGFKPIALWCYGMDAIELVKYMKNITGSFTKSKFDTGLMKNINDLQYMFDKALMGDEILIVGKKIKDIKNF